MLALVTLVAAATMVSGIVLAMSLDATMKTRTRVRNLVLGMTIAYKGVATVAATNLH